ncbi:hypothetical protein SCP_0116330 [Sparassis crispa]|uniref:Uncharacterized protein n=1 Tax=Sparassis crispa TaxID=139825 RepID=A0A401G9A6_9APHY|nr:hypothetical protein SCP_0116330 [Sparassis crispa]GBE78742.1 hypothetical protein SCP_0116330 [Sparassis crispa]
MRDAAGENVQRASLRVCSPWQWTCWRCVRGPQVPLLKLRGAPPHTVGAVPAAVASRRASQDTRSAVSIILALIPARCAAPSPITGRALRVPPSHTLAPVSGRNAASMIIARRRCKSAGLETRCASSRNAKTRPFSRQRVVSSLSFSGTGLASTPRPRTRTRLAPHFRGAPRSLPPLAHK